MGQTKAPGDYSTNPNTIRSRRRKSMLQGGAKVFEDARMADYKALIHARKAVQCKAEYRDASKAEQERMLREVMSETMKRRHSKRLDSRSKMEDYDAGNSKPQEGSEDAPARISMSQFLRDNNYFPPNQNFKSKELANGISSNNNNGNAHFTPFHPAHSFAGPGPGYGMSMGMGGPPPSAPINAMMPAHTPFQPQGYGPVMHAPPNPMEDMSNMAANANPNWSFPPPFTHMDQPFIPLHSVENLSANNGPPMLAPQPVHPPTPLAQSLLSHRHSMTPPPIAIPTPRPLRALPNNPPASPSRPAVPVGGGGGGGDNSLPGRDLDTIHNVLENLVPAVRNVTRRVDSLSAQVEQLRQELAAHKSRATDAAARLAQVEGGVAVLSGAAVPQLREVVGALAAAVDELKATASKAGQEGAGAADAEYAKVRELMKEFQSAMEGAGGDD